VSDVIRDRVESAVREVTAEEVAAYVENGWVKLDRLVDPEFAGELLGRARGLMGAGGDESEVRDGVDLKTSAWHDYHYPSEQDEVFRAAAFSPKMARNALLLLRATLPADVRAVRYWGDSLFVKLPKSGGTGFEATGFHTDHSVVMPWDRVGKMNFWCALDVVTPEQGSMRFYSGSHRLGDLGKYFPDGVSVVDAYPKLGEWCPLSPPLTLQPGDATVHQAGCVHGAAENTSGRPRWAYQMSYIQPEACYTGYPSHMTDGLGLEVGKPIEHPKFRVIYSEAV
jgi:Phytanoyl-CoA dioxygenase (PhyH)